MTSAAPSAADLAAFGLDPSWSRMIDVPASDVVPGDIALSSQDTAYLVARVDREGERVTLLDPLDNGEGGRPGRLVSIVRRDCLFGTAEQRLAHARGEAWLPHIARKGAK